MRQQQEQKWWGEKGEDGTRFPGVSDGVGAVSLGLQERHKRGSAFGVWEGLDDGFGMGGAGSLGITPLGLWW